MAPQTTRLERAFLEALASSLSIPDSPQFVQFFNDKNLFLAGGGGSRSPMLVGIPCIRNGRGGWGVLVGVWCSHVLDTISTNSSILASPLTPAV